MSLAIAVAKSEILWIWVPAIILAFVLRASTRQMKAARGNGEVP
jgi:hypothetical protein